jgi:predicted XRE-type DNA-binding protein
MARKSIKMVESCGNVFADLDLADSAILWLKANLQFRIKIAMEEQGLTQVGLARLLGVSQPTVSAQLNTLDGTSLERLMDILVRLGQSVEIGVLPTPEGQVPGWSFTDEEGTQKVIDKAPDNS